MNKSLTVIALTFTCVPLAFAEPGEAPKSPRNDTPAAERQPGDRAARGDRAGMGLRLVQGMNDVALSLDGLNDEQKRQINAVFDSAPQRMRELAEQTADMDRRERAGRMRELMAEMRSEVESSLTDAQKQEFETKLAEARERLRGDGAGPGPNPGPNAGPGPQGGPGAGRAAGPRMVERLATAIGQLDLSAEQKTQADKIIADLRTVADQARADVAGGADPQDVREKAREAFADAREQLGAILEPQQRQKLRELMQPDGAGPKRNADDGQKPKKDKN